MFIVAKMCYFVLLILWSGYVDEWGKAKPETLLKKFPTGLSKEKLGWSELDLKISSNYYFFHKEKNTYIYNWEIADLYLKIFTKSWNGLGWKWP